MKIFAISRSGDRIECDRDLCASSEKPGFLPYLRAVTKYSGKTRFLGPMRKFCRKLATIALAATATPSPEVAEVLLALLDAGKVASLDQLIWPAGENK